MNIKKCERMRAIRDAYIKAKNLGLVTYKKIIISDEDDIKIKNDYDS